MSRRYEWIGDEYEIVTDVQAMNEIIEEDGRFDDGDALMVFGNPWDAAAVLGTTLESIRDTLRTWLLAVETKIEEGPQPWAITTPDGKILGRFANDTDMREALITGDYPDDAEPTFING